MNALTLFDAPAGRVRATDRATSVDAARSVTGEIDTLALAFLRAHKGAFTSDEIATIIDRHPPSVVTAISRLSRQGHVVAAGEGTSLRGRRCTTWRAVEVVG